EEGDEEEGSEEEGSEEDNREDNEEDNDEYSDEDLDSYQHHEDDQHPLSTRSATAPHTSNLVRLADLNSVKDKERPSEPDSIGFLQSPRIPITISDDRSRDSDINARNLLALQGRNQRSGAVLSPPPLAPAKPPEDIAKYYNPGDPGGGSVGNFEQDSIRPDRAASAGLGTKTPERRVDGMHSTNHMASSGVFRPDYDGDAAPSNLFGSSMASANLAYIHPQPLDIPDEPISDLNKLLAYIEALQRRANALREQEPPQYKILHRLGGDNSSTVYLDAPQWAFGQNSSRVLKSSLPLSNISAYLEKHATVAFVVYRTYDKLKSPLLESKEAKYDEESGVFPPVEHTEESISIISDDLVLSLTEFLKTAPELTEFADTISQQGEGVPAPYLFIYHSRSVIHQYLEALPEQRRKRLSCLLEYIYSMYRDEYSEVDSLLERNKIRLQYIKYLFKPGEVLVERKGQDIRGFYTRSELSKHAVRRTSNKKDNPMASYVETLGRLIENSEQPSAKLNNSVYSWKFSGWSWEFDGTFSRVYSNLELSLEVHDKQEQSELNINDLNLFPLAFADECLKQRLKKRGETFWKCRFKHLVSYHDDDDIHDRDRSADERFMIDLMTYRELHKKQLERQKGNVSEDFKDDLGSEMMQRKDPPDGNFIYLLPVSIKGFNLQRKRWVDLRVDRMDDVVWNKKAFQSLVLANKTKDLIQALISKQLDSEKSTDLIHGKGNGLILLLHGGPGTGKTLTAESVAEIAEKPLYRVTCGDIGTEPEEVETYLESVLHLGKIWKGVVLLDEADVFLEQRSLVDLRRNALVSIFLRVLEYYDGILILTSNRVGTFDEAFKSRIQLALHYPKLDHVKRAKVWENFIERLADLKEENVDFADLKDNVEELAKNKMNGREIRNAITLARQYTQWKATKLNFAELQDIIKISGQFDIYLSELNRNITQDQLAQDDGLRLAEADK
ncbi:ATPase family AAA domain-containing protein, partial [Lachnellula subtilissima]